MSLSNEWIQDIRSMTTKINELSEKAASIKSRALRTSPLDFNALEIRGQVESISNQVSTLKNKAAEMHKEIPRLNAIGIFSTDQSNEIRERWSFMLIKGQSVSSSIEDATKFLRARNLWVALLSIFEDLVKSVEELVFKLAKPIIDGAQVLIQGSKTILSLPFWS